MSIVIKKTSACKRCSSPYIDYHRYVLVKGLDASGKFMTKETYVHDYDYCNVCYDSTQIVDAILIYIPAQQLLEVIPDYAKETITIYVVPHQVCNGNVGFINKQPKHLATIGLNEFTQPILQAILDESIPEQDRLDILGTLIDLQKLEHIGFDEYDEADKCDKILV